MQSIVACNQFSDKSDRRRKCDFQIKLAIRSLSHSPPANNGSLIKPRSCYTRRGRCLKACLAYVGLPSCLEGLPDDSVLQIPAS
jgi:hypothetical protein